jgi:hypothetical protein
VVNLRIKHASGVSEGEALCRSSATPLCLDVAASAAARAWRPAPAPGARARRPRPGPALGGPAPGRKGARPRHALPCAPLASLAPAAPAGSPGRPGSVPPRRPETTSMGHSCRSGGLDVPSMPFGPCPGADGHEAPVAGGRQRGAEGPAASHFYGSGPAGRRVTGRRVFRYGRNGRMPDPGRLLTPGSHSSRVKSVPSKLKLEQRVSGAACAQARRCRRSRVSQRSLGRAARQRDRVPSRYRRLARRRWRTARACPAPRACPLLLPATAPGARPVPPRAHG